MNQIPMWAGNRITPPQTGAITNALGIWKLGFRTLAIQSLAVSWERPVFFARLSRGVSQFRRARDGNIALLAALALPGIVLLAVGVIDLARVQFNRVKLQDMADAAALAGAREMSVALSDGAVIERTLAFFTGQLSEWAEAPDVTPEMRIIQRSNERLIEVILKGHSPSFFVNLLPPGGWNYQVTARAMPVRATPLCVLISGSTGTELLNVKDRARISAPNCLVHSNRDILVEGGSISASQVQAVTSASGIISPSPGTGALPIDDPFRGLVLSPQKPCPNVDVEDPEIKTGTIYLEPGIHCGDFIIGGDAHLILRPGEHWFLEGTLDVYGRARLSGEDVVLIFDEDSEFTFRENSTVNLVGRKQGAFTGMVMVAAPTNTKIFGISSDNVDSLLGVIYVPNAQLVIDGVVADIARDSAWTVIVAKKVLLKGAPSLIINANYDGSDVRVPDGVGPNRGSRLVE